MQMGFYFNQDLCTHCCACVVACKDWHDVPAGPASYIRIAVLEKGKYPEVSMCAMFGTCYHCAQPLPTQDKRASNCRPMVTQSLG